MRFRRALLSLVISALLNIVLVQIVKYIFAGSDFFEIELDYMFFGALAIFDFVPWLVVLVPLLFFTRFFDRWSWYLSGLFGFLIGAMVAILYKVLSLFIGSPWHLLLIIIWGMNMAIQFIVVSRTKSWAKAAIQAPVETQSSSQS